MAYLFSTNIDVHDENLDEFIVCVRKRPQNAWESTPPQDPPANEQMLTASPSMPEEPKSEKASGVSIETLRAAAAPLAEANRQDELIALLEEYDAVRLSGVPEAKRKAFLNDLKKLAEES